MKSQPNNNTVTASFVIVAVLLCVGGWATLPRAPQAPAGSAVGTRMFPNFDDPTKARRLEIFRYEEDTATIDQFEVVYRGGSWRLPSYDDYPADAQEQMVAAANLLIGLEVINVAETDEASRHAEYGVVDPSGASLEVGATGVGMRMNIYDESGSSLAQIIVGKEVPDTDGLRYVRNGAPNRDQVYVVKIDAQPISTKLQDWIEDDLLKISSWDIKEISTNKYAVQAAVTPQGQLITDRLDESRFSLVYDDEEVTWTAKEISAFDAQSGEWRDVSAAEGEELDTQKLNELRRNLADFKIVNVVRKPAELSDILERGDEELNDVRVLSTVIEPLLIRGFFPRPVEGGVFELLGRNGDMTVMMNNGVEYTLRFGETAGASDAEEDAAPAEGEETAEGSNAAAPKAGLNRYLMVTVRYDPTVIPEPVAEPIPQSLEEVTNPADLAAAEAAGAEEASEDAEPGEAEEGEEPASGDDTKAQTVEEAELAAAQEAVRQRNADAQAEYDEKVSEAKQKVDELNARFADWFFVISEDVFQKTSLEREDIVKLEEADDAAAGAAISGPAGPFDGLDLSDLGGLVGGAGAAEAPTEAPAEETEPVEAIEEEVVEEAPSEEGAEASAAEESPVATPGEAASDDAAEAPAEDTSAVETSTEETPATPE